MDRHVAIAKIALCYTLGR